ncbi:FAD-dependent oxidoreductase [Corynebacterium halotolerans]|uniref:Monooxygenase FAD-binding protein n=1 Tax=Corynebacterium halotolerans YIM 70093 = DSM 44683 TaxID=1121362 RepID=M1NIB2_9CORY|nr:FAD-dependent monooxygenase [Corynebacterium halotolerans]AGF71148.1 monooxygenase FAD-binding protein [Corynebacterium halotolerans YIM 70093 = DSM 44683]
MAVNTSADFSTDVFIMGSGPAGSSAALFLSTYGIDCVVASKYSNTANTPRAHITNQRTVEIMRDMGIEDQVKAEEVPHHMIGETVFCTAINGEEFGRVRSWGTGPDREGEYIAASPSLNCDLPQTHFEPILVRNAMARGAVFRWKTEYVSHAQDAEGVHTVVRDRLTGQTYTVHSKYLIGADGGRSQIAADLQLPMDGQMGVSGSMNIHCDMDLTEYCQDRQSSLYWVLQPGASVGGIGLGLVRMVRPWNEWLVTWGYDINQPPPEMDEAKAAEIVRNLVGIPDLDIKVHHWSLWTVNDIYATENMKGRVLCVGDAVHRHPPGNGLGSNTSIQDSYNLAWKIAHILKGKAGEELIQSYQDERVPVARQIVRRANKSIAEFDHVLDALGIDPADDADTMQAAMDVRKQPTAEGERRRQALHKALEIKNYEFNALGVELGQRYESAAVVSDGTDWPEPDRDPQLHYQPTTHPGARLPHAWLNTPSPAAPKVSTLDICGDGRFTILTGTNGQAWVDAARQLSQELGFELPAYKIGPDQDYTDTYGDWARLREIEDDGCLLVRPDNHVGYREARLVSDPTAALRDALETVLHLNADTARQQHEQQDSVLRLSHRELQTTNAQ